MKRIAWSTDIHLNFPERAALDEFIERLVDSAPDTLLLTGDIAEANSIVDYLKLLDDRLNCSICFVLGNHDFYYGAIDQVRAEVRQLCDERENLVYLTEMPCLAMSANVGLIGHDGWADARAGDYERSTVMLSDYRLIDTFVGRNKLERRSTLRGLGDAAAAAIRQSLTQAFERFAHVFLLTHVPPMREACWHNGRISDDEWAPHFTCIAMGEALLDVSREYPHRQLTVLCGHTHSPGEYQPLPHVQIITGGAEYAFPSINRVFRVSRSGNLCHGSLTDETAGAVTRLPARSRKPSAPTARGSGTAGSFAFAGLRLDRRVGRRVDRPDLAAVVGPSR